MATVLRTHLVDNVIVEFEKSLLMLDDEQYSMFLDRYPVKAFLDTSSRKIKNMDILKDIISAAVELPMIKLKPFTELAEKSLPELLKGEQCANIMEVISHIDSIPFNEAMSTTPAPFISDEELNDGPLSKEKMAKYREWEKNAMAKYGFIFHIVPDAPFINHPDLIDAHTHGLMQSFGHQELQVVIDLGKEDISIIINKIVDDIREGIVVKHGDILNGIIDNMPVMLFEVDKTLLRIILPNSNGDFPKALQNRTTVDKTNSVFGYQCDELLFNSDNPISLDENDDIFTEYIFTRWLSVDTIYSAIIDNFLEIAQNSYTDFKERIGEVSKFYMRSTRPIGLDKSTLFNSLIKKAAKAIYEEADYDIVLDYELADKMMNRITELINDVSVLE